MILVLLYEYCMSTYFIWGKSFCEISHYGKTVGCEWSKCLLLIEMFLMWNVCTVYACVDNSELLQYVLYFLGV